MPPVLAGILAFIIVCIIIVVYITAFNKNESVIDSDTLPNPQPVSIRYVRIEKDHTGQTYPTDRSWGDPAQNDTIQFAEVEVISGNTNVAPLGIATQDSTFNPLYSANKAIDGIKTGSYADKDFIHTSPGKNMSWWELKLNDNYLVNKVNVYPRTGMSYQRLGGARLILLNVNRIPQFIANLQGVNTKQEIIIPEVAI